MFRFYFFCFGKRPNDIIKEKASLVAQATSSAAMGRKVVNNTCLTRKLAKKQGKKHIL